MARFSWDKFFDDYRIEYVRQGANVARGNVYISCPLCGDDDSEHMGCSVKSPAWGCWRDDSHRGRKPHKLIMAIIGCSYEKACAIVGEGEGGNPEGFEGVESASLFAAKEEEVWEAPRLVIPDQFKTLTWSDFNRPKYRKFYGYLRGRGFDKPDTRWAFDRYDLKAAVGGEFDKRLIIPIYYKGELVSWTGRSVVGSQIRYKTLSPKRGGDYVATENIKDMVLGYDGLVSKGGSRLFVCEGPLDAIRLDLFLAGVGSDRATCMFSKDLRESQANLVYEISTRFEEVVVVLDQGEDAAAMKIAADLSCAMKARHATLPKGVDDPGDLTKETFDEFYEQFRVG